MALTQTIAKTTAGKPAGIVNKAGATTVVKTAATKPAAAPPAKKSVRDFLDTRGLKTAKASGGAFQKLQVGEYLVKIVQARFGETRKKIQNFTLSLEIASTSNPHPAMAVGRQADAYVGDAANDAYLPNVKAVVEAVFGLFGVTKEMIDEQSEDEFAGMLDDMFMEDQGAAGCYLWARAVEAKKVDPNTGSPYINVRFSTPTAEQFAEAGVEVNPDWAGVIVPTDDDIPV